MKKRKINWWNVGIILMVLAIIIILAFTPAMHRYANEYRHQFGIENGYGGECMVWAYPLIYLAIYSGREKKHGRN